MNIDKTSVTRLKDSRYEHLHVVVFRCLEEGVGCWTSRVRFDALADDAPCLGLGAEEVDLRIEDDKCRVRVIDLRACFRQLGISLAGRGVGRGSHHYQ